MTKKEQEMNVGVCPYSSTGLWKFVSEPIEQMTDRKILDWFIELSKLDGCENIDINEYLEDREIIQFFRENGISKESYDKYLYVYCSDATPFEDICNELGTDEVYVADGVWWSRTKGYYCED